MLNLMRLISQASRAAKSAALLAGALLPALTIGSAALAQDNPYGANYFPNTPLVTHDGRKVKFYDDLLKGKSVAINVIYTSCKDECPLETAKMSQLARMFGDKMGKDIFFYSISIDPTHDTPEVLKAYAKNFNTGPGWEFLTGKPDDIIALVKKIGLSRGADKANKDGHTASLMVGNEPTGQWVRQSAVDNPGFLFGTISSFLGFRDDAGSRAAYAQAAPLQVDPGQYKFESRCAVCHSINGGDKIGPDLADITKRRERAWVARYLMQPAKMRAEGDPIALDLFKRYKVQMPDQRLEKADLDDILLYLGTRSDAQPKVVSSKQDTEVNAPHSHKH